MVRYLFIPCLLFLSCFSFAQPVLDYYLPESIKYNPSIPTPKSILGFEVGEWHVSHDKLMEYMYALDKASERISLEVTGTTHENRKLLLLTITSEKNHQNIETLKREHLRLTDPPQSANLKTDAMPVVFYLGCSIHGNEPSGTNASLLMAYHLAAAEGEDIEKMLNNTIILLDPSFNPDGLQRFSTYVNSRKSKVISADPNDFEHNENWPTGRTNHYWFDLNRDWLVAQQPESKARVKKFHEWKPNLLTDHHEMGTNSTFFFQPGVPSRVHPLTPKVNQELTSKIGTYHAKALDEIGSLYYTQEGFDDFYYGKGSTFPDVQGSIGILFEQGSSRGHAQESTNGIVRFPFTIRNQFTTMLSSLKAANDLRVELLNYQRQFYKDANVEAAKDPVKGIIVGTSNDRASIHELARMISQHDIELLKPASNQTINGKIFDKESSFVIALNQKQYQLIKSMFEKRTSFTDSLFYDISSWTLPLAAGVQYEELKSIIPTNGKYDAFASLQQGKLVNGRSEYAYAFDAYGYYSPRAINRLLQQSIRIKVTTSTFHSGDKEFKNGSIIIPLTGQEKSPSAIDYTLNQIMQKDGIDIYGLTTGLDYSGSSLGSNDFLTVKKPEMAMLVEGDVSAVEAGEIWHLLDVTLEMPVTLLPVHLFNSTSINKYNTIIMPPGNYHSSITEAGKDKLKNWIQNGGVLIGFENALTWLNTQGLGKFEMKKLPIKKDSATWKPYAHISLYKGAQQTSGAIFEVQADLTHPLLYGYQHALLPVFKHTNIYMEKSRNAFANPIVYKSSPLLSGYISKENYAKLKDASYAGVSVLGKGRIIGFTEDLNFRAFWLGTNKMLTNAIFFGSLINEATSR